MTAFLYKSAISLVVLLVIYYLILEKQKMHEFNRFYLLFSLIFSFILPFITIKIATETAPEAGKFWVQSVPVQSRIVLEQSYDYTAIILWSLYGVVTTILLFRYIRNMLKIIKTVNANEVISHKNANLVLLEEQTSPHTFLNYIFLNKMDYQNRKIEEELYTHELIHVTQKHTLDVLLIETIKIFLWFNPVFIFYKKAIQLNHEFIADEKVINSFKDVAFYQNLLLSHSNTNPIFELTSNLNYAITKKRFIMMTKTVSGTKILLSKIALLPLFSGLIFFICAKSIGQTNEGLAYQVAEKTITASSGWNVSASKNESISTKQPEIMMSVAYSLEGMKINQPALQSTLGKISGYISNNYKSPEGIDKKEEEVSISFFLKKDGSITDLKINNEKGYKTEKDIIQILKSAPKFIPEKNHGDADWNSIAIKMDFWPLIVNDTMTISKKESKLKGSFAITGTDTLEKIDVKPEFPGGLNAFYEFVGKNYKIPSEASKNKIDTKLYVQFMVEQDGSLSEYKIVKDLGFGLGEEVIRVLKLSPKWSPATQDGKPVRVLYDLPITIQAEK